MDKRQLDFTRGSMAGVILRMAVPLTAAHLVNVLYNVVDRIYIGHIPGVGAMALTGVGLALPVITILSAFAGLFGQGGAPLFAIARGRGDDEEAGRILGNACSMLLISSAVLTALAELTAEPALRFLGAGDATIGYALRYLRLYVIGTPLVFLTLGMNPYVNAQGFARRGMLTVMLGAAANIVLDPVFMFVLGMGVRGAAAASVISQGLSAAWCMSFLTGKRVSVPLRRGYMPIRLRVVKKILSLGVTNFVMQSTNSLIQAVANRQLGLYGGDLYVGAMTIVNSLRTVFVEVVHGLSGGAQPVLGFNYGAGEKRRLLDGIRFTSLAGMAVAATFWICFVTFARPLVRIFTPDEAIIAVAVPAVRIFFCGSVFMALQFSGQCVFQGLGMAKRAITFSLLRKVVIVVPLMFLLPAVGLGANGVFWSEPISDLLGGGASFLTMLLTVYFPISREVKETKV